MLIETDSAWRGCGIVAALDTQVIYSTVYTIATHQRPAAPRRRSETSAVMPALRRRPDPRRPDRHRADLVVHRRFERRKVLLEPRHEVLRHHVIRGLVSPALPRVEDLV